MKSLEERLTDLELRFAAILPKQEEPELKEPMLECTGGEWYLEPTGTTECDKSSHSFRNAGVEHETETKAAKAGKRRVQQEIINNHATRLNKEDGYVADWKDGNPDKCYIAFCHYHNKWVANYEKYLKQTGDVVMSPKSAKHLSTMLNKGLIKGVNANGDI